MHFYIQRATSTDYFDKRSIGTVGRYGWLGVETPHAEV